MVGCDKLLLARSDVDLTASDFGIERKHSFATTKAKLEQRRRSIEWQSELLGSHFS
jgi:hypothetical protein